jgi:hypothetical protein
MGDRTMASLSYGFRTPADLFEKFKREGAKLGPTPNDDDIFDFFVTGASLNEWVFKVHADNEIVKQLRRALERDGTWEHLPQQSVSWITNFKCLPNRGCDPRRHIFHALRICWESAGASKHFHWQGKVESIGTKPKIAGWYNYFFTSRKPDLYVRYNGENYGLSQVREILNQFYEGLFPMLVGPDSEGGANAA